MIIDEAILDLVYKLNGWGIVLYVLITSVIASVLCFFIGLERQLKGKSNNVKTHVLLAVGCSFLMTISIWAIRIADGSLTLVGEHATRNDLTYDTSRIAAGVVSGMGFLGAGVIIKEKFTVKGLSTAATLWIAAAIGLACGAGFIVEATVIAIVAQIMLFIIERVSRHLSLYCPTIYIKFPRGYHLIDTLEDESKSNYLAYKSVHIVETHEDHYIGEIVFFHNFNHNKLNYFADILKNHEHIQVLELRYTKNKSVKF